ncbi:DUF4178 domain-containing protein [Occallatibacter riparius]|uniref:DUF4178 domain-containing protein n=1 Tax=Occallatibacter riparius TaxID=1002689 RepID=A0A9J7BXH1_9BACT|nr:DUF4178 domain-containing protein [Occallatibacter riparius]UWZ85861.1 DUF4178 domain-containing protein [Occallatibacter riparius]
MSATGPTPGGKPQVASLNCPGCGAGLTVRSLGNAVTIVCDSCHSILDARDPKLRILQQFRTKTNEDPPLIPLGTRGKIRGVLYEVIGFQRRTIKVEGISYSWHEYVLFNPMKGFRYLTEYEGHWNDLAPLRALPATAPGKSSLTYLGETYNHFQTAQANTTFVLGEFPWQVRVGESVRVSDYVSPPRVISSEGTGNEITWSMGEYMAGRDLWKAFNLEGEPPAPIGVYENQPSPPSANVKGIWKMVGVFVGLMLALFIYFFTTAEDREVFQQSYVFDTSAGGEASFVSNTFKLDGRTSDVELTTSADVDNNWIYVNYALINDDTGHAYDFGREVSYYHGHDSDGSWTEGSTKNRVIVPSVPAGLYYLRIEPESDPYHGSIRYTVTIRRDVPQISLFGIALAALLLPAAFLTWRAMSFEHLRWSESDYGKPPDDGSMVSAIGSMADSLKNSGGGE